MLSVGAFALVILGTAALLANEFIFDFGSFFTLVAAAANLIGLIGVGIALMRDRSAGESESGGRPTV